MYVLPSNDSVDSLYKISTRPDVEIAYVSFPITHLKEDKDSQQKDRPIRGRIEAVQKSCRNLSAFRKTAGKTL